MLLNVNKCHNLPTVQQPWRSLGEKLGCLAQRLFTRPPCPSAGHSVIQKKSPGGPGRWSQLAVHMQGTGLQCPPAAISPQELWEPFRGLCWVYPATAERVQSTRFWLAQIPVSPANWLLPHSQPALLEGSPHVGEVSAEGSLVKSYSVMLWQFLDNTRYLKYIVNSLTFRRRKYNTQTESELYSCFLIAVLPCNV